MTWHHVFTQWSLDAPVVIGLVLAALLYWSGRRNSLAVVGAHRSGMRRWQSFFFAAGLIVIFLALQSPVDYLAYSLFWAHMVQHVLLIMVAAPLLALGDPLVPLLRGFPLTVRRPVLAAAARQSWLRRLGHALGGLRSPVAVFAIFIIDLYLWHWNWLFNLTLRNQAIHDLEHLCFLATSLLFWSLVIDQRVLHARLGYWQRAVYVVITAFASNLLAMYFVFTLKPLYPHYATLRPRPFGIPALADQQLAGAIMWVPVLFLFGGAFVICFYKWLEQDSSAPVLPASPPASYSFLGSSSNRPHN